MSITTVLSPVVINEAFEALVQAVMQTKRLQEEKKIKMQELASEKASYMEEQRVMDSKWNFGKNDNERDATTRGLFPNLTDAIDTIDLKLMQNSEDTAMAKIEVDRVRTLISLFHVIALEE
jgi:hypothetical protein